MLRFRVANFRSILGEIELTTIASKPAAKPFKGKQRFFRAASLSESISALSVIFGANASGKTNLFRAIWFLQQAVLYSHTAWRPNAGVPITVFALNDRSLNSSFVMDLLIDGVRYEYGIEVSATRVEREWIFAWPNGKKQQWLSRERQQFDFGEKLAGHNRAMSDLTRDNALFLSVAAQHNHEQLKPLFSFFAEDLSTLFPGSGGPNSNRWWRRFLDSKHSAPERARVLALLRAADLGISDFRVRELDRASEQQLYFASSAGDNGDLRIPEKRLVLELAHGKTWFDTSSESTGTIQLLTLLPYLISALANGGVVCIDELNALHPMITVELVRLFQDFARNPNHAQLLFNTHDATLLGTTRGDEVMLSRDQVWFTEKTASGATTLVSLHDYQPRENENLERGYLQGRYGGVPYPGFDNLIAPKVVKS